MAADGTTPGSVTANDGLQNLVSGMGTSADKQFYNRFVAPAQDVRLEAEAAYRTSWLARKIHDLPPFDMTRAWRDWQADDDQIEKLEAEEKRLGIRQKVRSALTWARLRGGAALILGGLPGDPSLPVNPGAVAVGALKYVHVVTCDQLMVADTIRDITDPFFGEPVAYEMASDTRTVKIHPSRVIPFIGQPLPPTTLAPSISPNGIFWGEPLWQTIRDAVVNASLTHEGIAQLIQEAKVDTISIPDLMDLVSTAAGEAKVLRRLNISNLAKSTVNSRVMDANEKWETRQLTFTGLPDVLMAFLEIVAGAADIPVTRLLGTSAKGLNATGKGDEDNYFAMVAARQEVDLRPALERLDEFLVPTALGSTPADLYWTFAPLKEASEAEKAEIGKKKAETTKIYADTGLVPNVALAKATQNQLVEDGQYPGLESALAEAEAAGEVASILEEPEEDPSALTTGPDGRPLDPAQAEVQRRAANDAEPRTLYVSRKVVNAGEIIAWARGQGFETTLKAEDLHVTVAYSRAPVDWMKVGEAWGSFGDKKGQQTINPGGPRVVEKLGAEAVVLMFASSDLAWRHMAIREAGASWDWGDGYQPHITLTYQPGDVDLDDVEPYRGRIVLGPEVFEELDEDWKSRVVEDGGTPGGDLPFGDAYNPNQPRDRYGRWTATGLNGAIAAAGQNTRVLHDLGPPTEAEELLRQHGVDPTGYRRVVTNHAVSHAFKQHGDPIVEAARGQVAIVRTDFRRIPTIVARANAANTITWQGRLNGRKPPRLVYEAVIGRHRYTYIEHVRTGQRQVALLTLYRRRR